MLCYSPPNNSRGNCAWNRCRNQLVKIINFLRYYLTVLVYTKTTIFFLQDITYRILNYTKDGIPFSQQRRIFRKAFDLWQSASALRIREVYRGDADILISFVRQKHGDPYAFDRRGGTLAHAFYPHNNRGKSQVSFFAYIAAPAKYSPQTLGMRWFSARNFKGKYTNQIFSYKLSEKNWNASRNLLRELETKARKRKIWDSSNSPLISILFWALPKKLSGFEIIWTTDFYRLWIDFLKHPGSNSLKSKHDT